MHPASERPAGIAFGRFVVLPDRREVVAEGQPLKLGGRAFDALVALIEAPGAVVSKKALMARACGAGSSRTTVWLPRLPLFVPP